MSLVWFLRIVSIVLGGVFLVFLVKDCMAHKEDFTKEHGVTFSLIGFFTNVLDTLGIGSMATSMMSFRFTKSVKDEHLCGTGNVAFVIPVIAEFFLFLNLVEVDALTLIAMIGAAIFGSVIGAGMVSKWPVKLIRTVLGCALLIVAIISACRTLGLGPFGAIGTAVTLRGWRLAVGVIVNMLLGATQTMGIGLYAPCMALVSCLGMNISAAFPIMMGSCALLMPSASIKFIKEGMYNRKASVYISIFGTIGVLLTYYFIKSLPMKVLTWVVICVMIYTSFTFFRDVLKDKSSKEVENMN